MPVAGSDPGRSGRSPRWIAALCAVCALLVVLAVVIQFRLHTSRQFERALSREEMEDRLSPQEALDHVQRFTTPEAVQDAMGRSKDAPVKVETTAVRELQK